MNQGGASIDGSADEDRSPTDPPAILIVEDEERQRRILKKHLTNAGFSVEDFGTGEEALAAIEARNFDAILTDLRLPGIDGSERRQRALSLRPDVPAIVMTGHGSLDTAVDALRAGAQDYVLKPLFFDEIVRKLERLFEHRQLLAENARLRRALARPVQDGFLGNSHAAEEVRKWIERAAATDATVLITGPTGAGKDVVARAIHAASKGSDDVMLSINVAALPEAMVESELFGHERGAFTGATGKREGLLRSAASGTVFLDEIGEMPLQLQAKLLRALETREILPLGSDRPVRFEARILCATHRNLDELVRDGKFREDLRYRLDVLQIHVPPLAERIEDLPLLAEHILSRTCRRRGAATPVLSSEAIDVLRGYAWPGNVRELANVLERALILKRGDRIEACDLILRSSAPLTMTEEAKDLRSAVEDFERDFIRRTLARCDGNRERAADSLGLSQATLYRRLEKLGLKNLG